MIESKKNEGAQHELRNNLQRRTMSAVFSGLSQCRRISEIVPRNSDN